LSSKKNILVITYWSLDNALIHTYTLPYLKKIQTCLETDAKIYLLSLSPPGTLKKENNRAFVNRMANENIEIINFTYYPFGLRMMFTFLFMFPYLVFFSLFKKIKVLHAWCTPGGAIAWPISILTGKALVLDSFEPHAQSMLEAGTWKKNGLNFRALFLLEKLQLKRAKEVICAAEGMAEHSQRVYGIKKERYFVKPAGVDLGLFDPEQLPALDKKPVLNKHVCVYAGKFGGIYLSKEVFDFFKVAYEFWNKDFTVLLLSHHSMEEIQDFCHASGLPVNCVQLVHVTHKEVPAYLALASFAITPVKPMPSKLFCSPIKDGEYWAMGLPVVITKNISVDSRIIHDNAIGYVLQDFTEQEYLKALKTIEEIQKTNGLRQKIREIAKKQRTFDLSKTIYQTIYATNGVYSDGIR
jgi:glycosyltransferase involved in cell wall biosynthesis